MMNATVMEDLLQQILVIEICMIDIKARSSETICDEFGKTFVPMPPLEEQGRIVAKVGELLDKIEELR